MNEASACRIMRLRTNIWPVDWPLPTGAQTVMFRALQRAQPGAFVAAGNHDTGTFRIVVLHGRRRKALGREYVLLTTGQLRGVTAGEPYTEEISNVA